jgi:hypothetical protein
MRSIEPGRDTQTAAPALADWDEWDGPDTFRDPPAAATHHDLEVIPSFWTDSGDAAQRSSRRRVVIIVAAAAAEVAAIVWWLLHPHGDTSSVAITSAAPTTTTPGTLVETPSESEVAVPTVNMPVPAGQPATGPAADVAAGFAADYANTEGGKDAWFERISRWTAPQLTEGYRLTDPHRLPDSVFQRLSPPLNSDSGTVVYDAFYDTVTLEIRVVFIDERWLVLAALALDTAPRKGDSSPARGTPAPTTPYIPADIGPASSQ